MNALAPCPEDLLARAANAPLAPAERDLLAVHLARCETCRTAADVTGALAAEPSVLPGDELLIARLAERAAGRSGGIRLRRRRPLHVAAAVVAAAAAVAGVWHFARGRRSEPARTAESGADRRPGADRPPANRGAARDGAGRGAARDGAGRAAEDSAGRRRRARRSIASPRAGRHRRWISTACCPTPGRPGRAATTPGPARSTRASSAWRRGRRRPRWQRWRSA